MAYPSLSKLNIIMTMIQNKQYFRLGLLTVTVAGAIVMTGLAGYWNVAVVIEGVFLVLVWASFLVVSRERSASEATARKKRAIPRI